jgi:hypothetical protein
VPSSDYQKKTERKALTSCLHERPIVNNPERMRDSREVNIDSILIQKKSSKTVYSKRIGSPDTSFLLRRFI